jgi:hypothetical protein
LFKIVVIGTGSVGELFALTDLKKRRGQALQRHRIEGGGVVTDTVAAAHDRPLVAEQIEGKPMRGAKLFESSLTSHRSNRPEKPGSTRGSIWPGLFGCNDRERQ